MGYCSYTYYGQRDEVVKLWYSYTYPNPNPNPNPDPNPTPNQVGEPRIPVKPVGGWPGQAQDKPPPPPPPPPGSKQLGKRKAEEPNCTKRTVAGKSWVDQSLSDWPEDDFRVFVGETFTSTLTLTRALTLTLPLPTAH